MENKGQLPDNYPRTVTVLKRAFPNAEYKPKCHTAYYTIPQRTEYVAIFHTSNGSWRATLHDDYTGISGPPGPTPQTAIDYLNLEVSLFRDLIGSVNNG